MIVYLHGFNSSPASFKARLIRERLAALGRAAEFAAPLLPDRPRAAIETAAALIADHPDAVLVGSSLGGFYATWLAEHHGLRAVLVNPAVRAPRLLQDYVGVQKNLHTGREYAFTAQHVEELRALETAAITHPERYFLLATTGDEVLDYRDAVALYRGARQCIVDGGDHGFSDFGRHVDAVIAFCDGRVEPV
jgi:predicted esterase YcpF (UPF0227 family)